MKHKGKTKNKPTKGTENKKQEEILKQLKDYEDHKLLDAEIARYGNPGFKAYSCITALDERISRYANPGYKADYYKPLEAEIAEYVARNKPTKGTMKNKVEEGDYVDQRVFSNYKAWFFDRAHATVGAEFIFVRWEYDELVELFKQGMTFSPPHFKICILLKQELKRLERKMHNEAAASLRPCMGNPKYATRGKFKELLIEGATHINIWEPFNWRRAEEIAKEEEASMEKGEGWEEEIAKDIEAYKKKDLVSEKQKNKGRAEEHEDKKSGLMMRLKREASVERELGAEKKKDEGWDEEQEDKKSASTKEVSSSTMAVSSSTMEYKRWSLIEEVDKLISQMLKSCFPKLGEKSMFIICKEKYGDYQCENVLSIWPKLIEKDAQLAELEGPTSVGKTIAMQLRKRTDMIEGTPCIHDIGFVTFKLSGKWIAKSLHKMLSDGINTWAPKLSVKKVIVEIPEYESTYWNSVVGAEVDIIRPNFVRDTFIRMLEYSEVLVKSGNDEFRRDAISRCPDIWNRSLSFDIRDGDVVVSAKVRGKRKSLNFGKRNTCDISDSLKILWYELNGEGADWIVSLNPVRHQEFVDMCSAAAKHAGWIPTAKHRGLSFAGYQTHAEAGKLVYLLEKALTRCISIVKQGKAAGYTAERVFCCAVRYEYLKIHRMTDCTFNVDDMLNEKGNTFVSLLNTKNQVLSVLANSGEDINKLKNVSELMLETVEVLEKDEGRALGLHLLKFTQVLEESCLSVLPHILCQYLHELAQKFTNYNSSYSREVGSVAETSRLILCKATAAVMDKCFHLLGITLVSISGESSNKPVNKLLSDLEKQMGPKDIFISCYDSVLPSLPRDPPKNSRLEIVAIHPRISKDLGFRSLKLSGFLEVQDKYGLLSEAWGPTTQPDCGLVSLFESEWYNSMDIKNHEFVPVSNPINARHSVPLPSSYFLIRAELLITTVEADAFFRLPVAMKKVKVSDFMDDEGVGKCGGVIINGEEWSALIYCILIKNAVDTNLKVEFGTENALLEVHGEILAYYGDEFPYSDDSIVKAIHMVSLVEPDPRSLIKRGPVQLKRSKLAVPKEGSLVIKAELVDQSGEVVLKGCYRFPSKIEKDSTYRIDGTDCFLDLKVEWEYLA